MSMRAPRAVKRPHPVKFGRVADENRGKVTLRMVGPTSVRLKASSGRVEIFESQVVLSGGPSQSPMCCLRVH